MQIFPRLPGLLVLVAYAALAFTPCLAPPQGFQAAADAPASEAQRRFAAWCLGEAAPEPPPVMNVVCPCGCERPAGLAGPTSLDHGLLQRFIIVENAALALDPAKVSENGRPRSPRQGDREDTR